MTQMTIRAAKVIDARGIAEVHIAAWQTAYRGLLPERILKDLSVSESETRWRQRLGETTTQTFVAEQEGQVVGFVTCGRSRDHDANKARVGEIYAFYVGPTVWRQGHGRRLCSRALAALQARGFAEVTLWVLRNNRQAIKFYRAVGFTADGVIKTERWRGGVEIQQTRYRQVLRKGNV